MTLSLSLIFFLILRLSVQLLHKYEAVMSHQVIYSYCEDHKVAAMRFKHTEDVQEHVPLKQRNLREMFSGKPLVIHLAESCFNLAPCVIMLNLVSLT